MVVKTEKAGYTVVRTKPGEAFRLDEPYVIEDMPKLHDGEELTMQRIWQEAARYRVEAHNEDLGSLIQRSVVLYHIPPFDTAPAALARILSGENASWRIFRVKVMEDTERFYLSLILKAGMNGSERYQTAEVGLDFGQLTDMAVKVIKDAGDNSIYEVAYKRARDGETGLQRLALAFFVDANEKGQGIDIDAL